LSGFYTQDAGKSRQHRSRVAQRLNVPKRVHLASSLAAVLLDGLFEHPAKVFFWRAGKMNGSVLKIQSVD